MDLAEKLLALLLSEDPEVSAQGRELLASRADLAERLLGVSGLAWAAPDGLSLFLAHFDIDETDHQDLTELCTWATDCLDQALPMISGIPPETLYAGIRVFRALAAGVSDDNPMPVAMLTRRLMRFAQAKPIAEDVSLTIGGHFSDLLSALSIWFSNLQILDHDALEDETPEDAERLQSEAMEDIHRAQMRIMQAWIRTAPIIHRSLAGLEGDDALTEAIRWQSEAFHSRFA